MTNEKALDKGTPLWRLSKKVPVCGGQDHTGLPGFLFDPYIRRIYRRSDLH